MLDMTTTKERTVVPAYFLVVVRDPGEPTSGVRRVERRFTFAEEPAADACRDAAEAAGLEARKSAIEVYD